MHLCILQGSYNKQLLFILDFKIPSCCERCILSFGWFPGVWILCAEVSEHTVCYIFVRQVNKKNNRYEIARVFMQVKFWLKRSLTYTALVRPILEYGAVCWDPYREGQVSALNRVQKRAAKFANNINESCWETLAQRRLRARICVLFKAYTWGRAWKVIGG